MWRLVLTFLMISIALPAVAQSDILDIEFCKARFLNAKERLKLEESESLGDTKIVSRFEPSQIDRNQYDECIDNGTYPSEKAYYKKSLAMILNDGGFLTGPVEVCKKIDYFELRRPTKSQCWRLPKGTNVTIENTGLKVPIKVSWWSTVYGDAEICGGRGFSGCIQTHKKID